MTDDERPATGPVPRARQSPAPRPATGAHRAVHAVPPPAPGGWRALGRALRFHPSPSQILIGLLCAILGFALVVQLGQSNRDKFSSLRQSDLVRLLDDVTTRSTELEDQVDALRATRDKLAAGAERQRAAEELARTQAQTQGILSGRLRAEGPGVTIDIVSAGPLAATAMVNLLEELRNAGAEVIEVNGVRLVTDSYFTDTDKRLSVDDTALASPIHWTAIGDPATIETALKIHGGAVDALTSLGAQTTITTHDLVQITATVQPGDPRYATPAS